MTQLYNISSVTENSSGFGLPFAGIVYSARLAATTDTSLTIPGGASLGKPMDNVNKFIAVISYEDAASVFVAKGEAAAVPAAGTFGATASELNPPAKIVSAGDVIHFMAVAADTDVTVALYSI
jgi:hypothetical protein